MKIPADITFVIAGKTSRSGLASKQGQVYRRYYIPNSHLSVVRYHIYLDRVTTLHIEKTCSLPSLSEQSFNGISLWYSQENMHLDHLFQLSSSKYCHTCLSSVANGVAIRGGAASWFGDMVMSSRNEAWSGGVKFREPFILRMASHDGYDRDAYSYR